MKKNLKFLELMACLDTEELSLFEKYLLHEYPNEGNALKVFRYYKRFFPGKENPEKMALAYAFRKIYRAETEAQPNAMKKLWNDFSRLYGWLKNFLILEKFKADRFAADVYWMEILQQKKLYAAYSKYATAAAETRYEAANETKDILQRIELGWYYRQQFVLDRPAPDYKNIAPGIWKMHENADLLSIQLKCEWLTIKEVRPTKAPLQPPPEASDPLYAIYQQIYLMLTTEESRYFEAIENLLQIHGSAISSKITSDILRYLHNHAANRYREGLELLWGTKVHRLNKSLIVKETYSDHKGITASNFQNIITFACVADDLQWARQFIEDYAQFLPRESREENKYMAQVTLAYARKDFKMVLALCEASDFKNEIQVLPIKVFQFRAMYELGMDISDPLEAFMNYMIRRRKPVTAYKESAIAFLTILQMLIHQKVSKEELLKAFNSYPQVTVKSWLKSKIDTYRSVIYRRKSG